MHYAIAFLMVVSVPVFAETARDPGVRGGRPGAGNILAGFNIFESVILNQGRQEFGRRRDVRDGLGPAFNGDSCIACHSQPTIGGTSPAINAQIGIGTRGGAANQIPSFLQRNGPTLVVRLRYKMDASGNPTQERDGGVVNLFTIAGRTDARGCGLPQADLERAHAANNLAFRIPTPVFGMGLVEAISDAAILGAHQASAGVRASLGIGGRPNRSAADGTIMRFGWKAQSRSTELFTGEAFNVEMGITNDIFSHERTTRTDCLVNRTPEDSTNLQAIIKSRAMSDAAKVALWMRALRPPQAAATNRSTTNGLNLFSQIGCTSCHTPSFSVNASSQREVARVGQAFPFSDFLLHRMGPNLADDIVQGDAGPDEFRTAPLWGVGQRIFFLHDGRTTDIQEAILQHASEANDRFPPSEANAVIQRYRQLTEPQKQDILNFLRIL